MLKKYLPSKIWLILIAVFSLIAPLHMLLLYAHPNDSLVFAGLGGDDAIVQATMASYHFGFESPWSPGESVFNSPGLSSAYVHVFIGVLLGFAAAPFVALIIVHFLLSFALYIVVYNFLRFFLKKELDLAFLMFLMPVGAGGILYILSFFWFGPHFTPLVGLLSSYEFGMYSISLPFRLVPQITGFLSILAYRKDKKLLSGVLLGITNISYPFLGFGFSLLLVLLEISYYKKGVLASAKKMLAVLITGAIFLLPWLAGYFSNRSYFSAYSGIAGESVLLLPLIGSMAIPLVLIFVAYRKFLKKFALLLSAVVIFSAALVLAQLYNFALSDSSLLTKWIKLVQLENTMKAFAGWLGIIEAVFFALFLISAFYIVRRRISPRMKFFALWLLLLSSLSVITAGFVFWNPSRLFIILKVPFVVFASLAAYRLASNFKIKIKFLFAAFLVISLPMFVAANAWVQVMPRRDANVWYDHEDYSAMLFLRENPEGYVLCSSKIGSYLPAISYKQAFQFVAPHLVILNAKERENDYKAFYSADSGDGLRAAIIRKYNFTYVFQSFEGQRDGYENLNMDSLKYLVKIYDNGAKIYAVNASLLHVS
jgi:hypothetical protein